MRYVFLAKRVFLGGTCNDSGWREELKPLLGIDYFDPVVDDWDDEARARERYERWEADFVLYVITPKMTGVYAIAEAVDDSNKRPEKTIFVCLPADGGKVFDEGQRRSLAAVAGMIERNGGRVFDNLVDVAEYLNRGAGR